MESVCFYQVSDALSKLAGRILVCLGLRPMRFDHSLVASEDYFRFRGSFCMVERVNDESDESEADTRFRAHD